MVPIFSRLNEISHSELKTRAMASVGHWVAGYTFLTLLHSIIAFATVLLGIYEPKSWPPLFGSVREIYSIRQTWG
jgi:hypothetical protein